MRFLVVQPGPAFSVHDLYVGWCEALQGLGHTVVDFNMDARLTFYATAKWDKDGADHMLTQPQATEFAANGLAAALYKVRPDVLLVISGFFVPHNLLALTRRAYGTKVVVVHTEEPYEHDREIALAQHADLNLVNDPTHLDDYAGLNGHYFRHAYRPTLHYPGPATPDLTCDLGFVGTGYESRIRFFEAMDLAGLDVLLGGNWQQLSEDSPLRKYVGHDIEECLDNDQTAAMYRSARCGINLYRKESSDGGSAEGWAVGPREIEAAACGGFFLREPRPEGDELFPMLPRFESPEHASELLRWWLAHDRLREDAAHSARIAVQDRTFDAHARQLMRLLETNTRSGQIG